MRFDGGPLRGKTGTYRRCRFEGKESYSLAVETSPKTDFELSQNLSRNVEDTASLPNVNLYHEPCERQIETTVYLSNSELDTSASEPTRRTVEDRGRHRPKISTEQSRERSVGIWNRPVVT